MLEKSSIKLKRVYLEITNRCNLNCDFCKPHHRMFQDMSLAQFEHVLKEMKGITEYLYFHVKGEPLLHPLVHEFAKLAYEKGFQINLTTNGTLLEQHLAMAPFLRQINLSFHATNNSAFIETCKKIQDCIVNYRIWNKSENKKAIEILANAYGFTKEQIIEQLQKNPNGNFTLAPNVFLSTAEKFEWPDLEAQDRHYESGYCHALKDQIGILVDGTVVPCCLDDEGSIALGNIFEAPLLNILTNERACAMREGFQKRVAIEDLCQRCSYKNRF